MPKLRITSSYFAIPLICLGLALTIAGRARQKTLNLRVESPGYTTLEIFPSIASTKPVALPPWLVSLAIDLITPKSITLGEGFVIEARFAIDKVTQGDKIVTQDSFEMKEIERNLRSVHAMLSIAGMTISPDDYMKVDNGLRAQWSVKAEKPGKFVGFVRATLDPIYFDYLKKRKVGIELPPGERFVLDVPGDWRHIISAIGDVVLVAGGAILIIQIIQFIWQVIDRKREGNAKRDPQQDADWVATVHSAQQNAGAGNPSNVKDPSPPVPSTLPETNKKDGK